MLQLLICSDLHTFIQNIPPALDRIDRVDAILIAGDLEAEQDELLALTGGIPVYAVAGNNDYYLNTEYPEELLIDIKSTAGSAPYIENVRELRYSDQPEKYARLPSILRRQPFDKISAARWGEHRPNTVSHRILMTHGKEYGVPDLQLLTSRAVLWGANLVIYGHTHRFADTTVRGGNLRLINPGCLMGDPHDTVRTYAKYEICSFAVLRLGFDNEISLQHLYV